MENKIIIDIDNTLWDFSPVFWKHLRDINPDITPPQAWDRWDFWEVYVSKKELYDAIHRIHMDQEKYPPYGEAKPFLTSLKEKGFYIIIASHREQESFDGTVRWLNKYGLPFDEIYLSDDKSILFKDCCAIVDDSPFMLDKAKYAGIVRTGLLHPWNARTDHPLFNSLQEVLNYIESQCSSKGEDRKRNIPSLW